MTKVARSFRWVALLAVLAVFARGQTLITPTSATASEVYGNASAYDIANVINGSGLPVGFGLSDLHDNYGGGNHWTTGSTNLPGDQYATFFFSTPQSLTHFYLWNHRSNIIANSPNYYVTQFDLIFRNSDNNVIATVNDLTATGGTAAVQTFIFSQVDGVASVIFDIDSNAGDPLTGVAEVRFGLVAVPEPATAAFALAAVGLAVAVARRRRR